MYALALELRGVYRDSLSCHVISSTGVISFPTLGVFHLSFMLCFVYSFTSTGEQRGFASLLKGGPICELYPGTRNQWCIFTIDLLSFQSLLSNNSLKLQYFLQPTSNHSYTFCLRAAFTLTQFSLLAGTSFISPMILIIPVSQFAKVL